MAYWAGAITLSSTGTAKSFPVGFQPTWAEFRVGQKSGTTETVNHLSLGEVDTTGYQYCTSTFTDASGSTTVNYSTKVVSHRERSGGIVEVLSASFNSFYSTGIKLDVSIANSNYPVVLRCGN